MLFRVDKLGSFPSTHDIFHYRISFNGLRYVKVQDSDSLIGDQ